MPDIMNHHDNDLYVQVLTWLNRNMRTIFNKDTATTLAAALHATTKQLEELPTLSPINAQLAYLRTLLQNTPIERLHWNNFQIFIYEKLERRQPEHQKLISDLKTHDWEIITNALTAFSRQQP